MSFKKIFLSITLLSIFILPFFGNVSKVQAITAEEIKAQIDALMAQIKALQQQLAGIEEQPAIWCYDFNINLRIGDKGAEVQALQTALSKEFGRPAGNMDNAFDEFTASSVVEFQEKYASEILSPWRLEHGTGYVGSTTRQKLNAIYGCGVLPPAQCLKEGEASARCIGSSGVCAGVVYPTQYCCSGLSKIPYSYVNTDGGCSLVDGFVCTYCGNNVCGSGENWCNCPQDCKEEKLISVISPNGGEKWVIGNTYTIKWNVFYPSTEEVKIALRDTRYDMFSESPLGQVVIASTQNTGSYIWTIPTKLVDSLGRVMELGAGNVYKIAVYTARPGGECPKETCDESNNYFSIAAVSCHATPLWDWDYCSATCQCKAGEGDCDVDSDCTTGYCAQDVGAKYGQVLSMDVCEEKEVEQNLPPVIDELTAPTQLKVNQQGTWQVRAHDPENGALNYQINWGDEPMVAQLESSSVKEIQTTTFTHTYSQAGTYTISFTITDDHQQSAKTSTTVKVVKEEVEVTCTDSDGGKDYYVKGTMIEGGKTYEDVCAPSSASPDTLWERACTGSVFYDCSYGCENGACKKGITVTSPNGGENWIIGNTYTIKWNNEAYPSNASVQIGIRDTRYDPNLGSGEAHIVNTTNNGTYTWTVPSKQEVMTLGAGNVYKMVIYLEEGGPGKFDISDNYFSTVAATSAKPDLIVKDFTYRNLPRTSSDIYAYFDITIQNIGQSSALLPEGMKTNIYKNSLSASNVIGGVYIGVARTLLPNQTYTFTNVTTLQNADLSDVSTVIVQTDDSNMVPESNDVNNDLRKAVTCADTDGGLDYYVKGVMNDGGKTYTDVCAPSSASPDTLWERACTGSVFYDCSYGCENGACKKGITVTAPNGGEQWDAGFTYNIAWISAGLTDNVGITILENHQRYCEPSGACIETTVAPNTGSYAWSIPKDFEAGDNVYTVKVEDESNSSIYDESDNYFSIIGATTAVGSLSAFLNAASPSGAFTTGANREVIRFDLTAGLENIQVNSITVLVEGLVGISALKNVKLYAVSDQMNSLASINSLSVNSGNGIFTGINRIIQKEVTETFMIKADVSLTTLQAVKIIINAIEAKGIPSNALIPVSGLPVNGNTLIASAGFDGIENQLASVSSAVADLIAKVKALIGE